MGLCEEKKRRGDCRMSDSLLLKNLVANVFTI